LQRNCAHREEFKETGKVPNVVNLARQTPATHRLVVRHLDRPGVLAGVLDAIKAEQINVQEMENIVFEGAAAAVARINLDNAPTKKPSGNSRPATPISSSSICLTENLATDFTDPGPD
jgi:D-3-phosphoglycerate dehydrogenase